MAKRVASVVSVRYLIAVVVAATTLVVACGQKGPLIAVRPAAGASSPALSAASAAAQSSRAPLPPPEPLETPIPGTAPR